MAEVWVAAIGATAAVAGTAYSIKSSEDAKKKAASASGSISTSLKTPKKMPKFIAANPDAINQQAIGYDQAAYARSDADFSQRHQPLVQAEKLFENQTLKDQQGNSTLTPELQNEYMRAGLQGALSSFGNTPNTLAVGSAGEADVARNLGLSINTLQQQTRNNAQQSLVTAEQLFPRRTFGLTGADASQIDLTNITGQNNFNQAMFAQQSQTAAGQLNAQTASNNALASASANADATKTQAIVSAAELAAKLYASRSGAASVTPAAAPAATTAATTAAVPAAYTTTWKAAA